MYRIGAVARDYAWGSTTAIADFLGVPPTGAPCAEVWLGAHPSAPSPLLHSDGATDAAPPARPGRDLRSLIAADPIAALGAEVAARFDSTLPFLVKLLAPAQAVSLQVHPGAEQARETFAQQQASGIVFEDPSRGFKDPFHKPEMVYALTPFRGLVGFRDRVESAELLGRLDVAVLAPVVAQLSGEDDRAVERAFTLLLTTITADAVDEAVERSAVLARRHPAYAAVGEIARHYPGDTGVVASLMLNLVTLSPGEAVFVNDGVPHAYLSGLALEIMANSDNVIRAGLTVKHVDVPALLACADFTDAAAVVLTGDLLGPDTRVFRPDAAEFALAVITSSVTTATARPSASTVAQGGPSIVLALSGELTIGTGESALSLRPGEAAFLPASIGMQPVGGNGVLAQTFVPA